MAEFADEVPAYRPETLAVRAGQERSQFGEHAEALAPGMLFEHIGKLDTFDRMARRTFGLQEQPGVAITVLAGGGDPTLQTDQLGDLVARLAGTGVRGATGRFLHWAGALPRIDRISDDQPDHVGYNPAISGLNLNFNRVHFEWKRAAGGGWGVLGGLGVSA